MNKNKVFLSSLLIILILLGAFLVFSGSKLSTRGTYIKTQMKPFNWTGDSGKNKTEIINFTINNTGNDDNIIQIRITVPGNFTVLNVSNGSGWWNGTGASGAGGRDVFNFTKNGSVVIFKARNVTGGGIKENKTLYVWFNITVRGDNKTEKYMVWNISTYDNSSGSNQTLRRTFHGVDGAAPRFSSMSANNITYTKTKTDLLNASSSDWFRNSSNITVTLIVNETNNMTAKICINWTRIVNNVSDLTAFPHNCRNATMTSRGAVTGNLKNYTYMINYSFLKPANGGNLSFIFVVTDTLGNVRNINNTNHTAFRIRTDGTAPTANLIQPNVKTVETQQEIKYKCRGSDEQSGLKSCTLEVTKPDGTKFTRTGCDTEQKLKLSDTNRAGTYYVQCKIKNNVDQLTTTEKKTFLALYPSEPEEGVLIVDMDFSTGEKKQISKKGQGSVIDFTLDGLTRHTITFTEVDIDRVKLSIASNPSEVELGVGESIDVDVDEDGVNDIKVTLSKVESGQGEITIDVLEKVIPEEETTPEEKKELEVKVKRGIVLLMALILIVIGILVHSLVKLKRSRRLKGKGYKGEWYR